MELATWVTLTAVIALHGILVGWSMRMLVEEWVNERKHDEQGRTNGEDAETD